MQSLHTAATLPFSSSLQRKTSDMIGIQENKKMHTYTSSQKNECRHTHHIYSTQFSLLVLFKDRGGDFRVANELRLK